MKTQIDFTRTSIVVPPSPNSLGETGACVEFHGLVRESEDGRKIPLLEYEAYEAMAKQQLERIMAELVAAHPCQEVHFIHRLGPVAVGEASLYLRVLSRHREEAFNFASALVTRLKVDVPIWKAPPPASR